MECFFGDIWQKAFMKPNLRPTQNVERGLIKTWDMIHSCPKSKLRKNILYYMTLITPFGLFCNTRIKDEKYWLKFYTTERL